MTAIIILATLATMQLENLLHLHYHSTNTVVLAVDTATFIAMYAVAVKSRLWWPIWVAAFQLNSVVAHLATVISPEFSALVYHGYEGMWAIPGQLVMVIGIHRDRGWTQNYDLT
ncbi:hypothetical protein KK488_11495 [Sphingobium sp. H33]|uniref:Uncharacterized protein n=2 Tax=Sphingobium nicotianae TaxID=2782607 RepID=A0A9X1DCX1_9SPHN|nr:hypothetical protein [Sphingobium nicotianae]